MSGRHAGRERHVEGALPVHVHGRIAAWWWHCCQSAVRPLLTPTPQTPSLPLPPLATLASPPAGKNKLDAQKAKKTAHGAALNF